MRFAGSLKIGTFFRTRIRIHYTWLLVFVLVPWAVSTQFSTETALTTRAVAGGVTALLFFFAVFLREIALLVFAFKKGISVNSVIIFAFGGLIETDEETETPSLELLLAVAGMLGNLVISGLFYFSSLFFDTSEHLLVNVPLKWLAFFYLTLTLFHIIPAFPLEGGRMVHVLLWKVTDNYRKATRISSISGWIIGFLVMAGGIVLIVLTAERFTGMFFTGLGLILQNAATRSIRQMKQRPVPPSRESPPEPVTFIEELIPPVDEVRSVEEADQPIEEAAPTEPGQPVEEIIPAEEVTQGPLPGSHR